MRPHSMTVSFLRRLLVGLALLPPAHLVEFATPPAWADSFNMKPGAWEITTTVQLSGSRIPPEILAKMPPEQRAKTEQAERTAALNPKSIVSKECITKEDLDHDRIIKEGEEESESPCPTTIITKSSNKLVLERSCPPPKESVSNILLEAPSPESLVGKFDRIQQGRKIHSEMKGRWLGASCAGIER